MSTAHDELLGVDEARARMLDAVAPLADETVPLVEAAGRALAAELRALRSLPGFDNSAMDGVGVRVADVTGASDAAPVTLRLVGEALAGGAAATASLAGGEAVRIMTGAAIPPGVEAVVMREHTDERDVERGLIHVKAAAPAGQHVRRVGEDVRQGGVVGRAGDVITPARLNLVLAAGHVSARVVRRPMVAVLASGDELCEVGAPLDERAVINSNAHAIAAAVRAAGGEARLLGIARDSLADHVAHIREAAFADVLLTVGGVSMGTHDFVRPALAEVGCTLSLWRVAMRPGKPVAFGTSDGGSARYVVGLPGNPVSAMVGFELFVRPALRKLLGVSSPWTRPLHWATLAEGTKKKAGLEHWARARVTRADGALIATLLDAQGSHQISGLADADALVRLPRAATTLAAGERVEAMLLD
ncbi:MAG: molybdopterin molybdotransferase MoeA [Deltaproteobacteria bacterium]|nr:molybdopterin molybdotransferase MoeA [Deltaproteobacteria bacterium]